LALILLDLGVVMRLYEISNISQIPDHQKMKRWIEEKRKQGRT